ncbi:MAG: 3-phosphoglycerate dehydrogenase, partial [Burkholderiales bacterium]|nr:3-phosphoglycerate dehydrogenase [Burkholderiales bacterium]
VTTARAGIHDEAALIDALTNRRIAGAGIDVWDVEPPPLDHPLLRLDNVIATPHIAGATIESRTHASELAAQQIIQALAGQRPPQLLNPEVWPVFLQRLAQAFPERATASIGSDQETK